MRAVCNCRVYKKNVFLKYMLSILLVALRKNQPHVSLSGLFTITLTGTHNTVTLHVLTYTHIQ